MTHDPHEGTPYEGTIVGGQGRDTEEVVEAAGRTAWLVVGAVFLVLMGLAWVMMGGLR
jgi:hypothetical protein